MPIPSLFIAESSHFEVFSATVNEIQELCLKGGEFYFLGLEKFKRYSQNILLAFSWISRSFIKDQNLAKKCCDFVLNSRSFLINFPPSIRLEWLNIAYQASKYTNDKFTQMVFILEMGNASWFLGDFKHAIYLSQKVIDQYQTSFDKNLLGSAYGLIGLANSDIGDFNSAIKNLKIALSILNEDKQQSIYLPILGKCYDYIGRVEDALQCYRVALVLAQKIGDTRNKADIMGNIGLSYLKMGNKTKSLHLFIKAFKLTRKVRDKRGESNQLINLSSVYIRFGNYHKAELCINEAISICSVTQNPKGLFKCKLIQAKCSLHRFDIPSSIKDLKSAYYLSRKLKITKNVSKLRRYI